MSGRYPFSWPLTENVRGIEKETKTKRRMGRYSRQQLSQWSRGVQERYLKEKTGLDLEHLNESGSTKTCPTCLTRNRPSGRYYRCKNTICGFTCHRDTVGAINILQKAIYGEYLPIGPDTKLRVTYLRAVECWSTALTFDTPLGAAPQGQSPSSAQMWALSEELRLANRRKQSHLPVPIHRYQTSWSR